MIIAWVKEECITDAFNDPFGDPLPEESLEDPPASSQSSSSSGWGFMSLVRWVLSG
jgi:hypothetical protein